MKETMSLKICGFYIKHESLRHLTDDNFSLDFKKGYDRYRNNIGNMDGTVILEKGSSKARLQKNDNDKACMGGNITITYISSINMDPKPYPELQFGEHGAFRLILEPTEEIGREEIEKFIKQ